ncbi:MAG TPA: hypothetical protein VFF85_03710, partial [Microbacterium sp.]|nr:hypothetical protein [Microbacterium sp.]
MNNSRSHRQRRLTATIGVALLVAIVITAIILIGQQASSPASATVGAPISDGQVGEDDGKIDEADRISVFADTPAVSNLDPALLTAVRNAATAAEQDGVRLHVNSGWRSAAY